jgi:hypothetical protein
MGWGSLGGKDWDLAGLGWGFARVCAPHHRVRLHFALGLAGLMNQGLQKLIRKAGGTTASGCLARRWEDPHWALDSASPKHLLSAHWNWEMLVAGYLCGNCQGRTTWKLQCFGGMFGMAVSLATGWMDSYSCQMCMAPCTNRRDEPLCVGMGKIGR